MSPLGDDDMLYILLLVTFVTAGGDSTRQARIRTIAGTGTAGYGGDGDKATAAQLNEPFHCDLDRAGNLYIADNFNHCIRRVDAKTGIITTVAGTGRKGYAGDGGPAAKATLNEPYAVAVGTNGDLFVVD